MSATYMQGKKRDRVKTDEKKRRVGTSKEKEEVRCALRKREEEVCPRIKRKGTMSKVNKERRYAQRYAQGKKRKGTTPKEKREG